MKVGLIADTHGLMRPEALAALQGVDRIVHAGDIGNASILDALERIAPVTAVRGNNDTGDWTRRLHDEERLSVEGVEILVLHDLASLGAAPPDVHVVVTGHSHVPRIVEEAGIAYVNPGSAGPRRFRLPVSVGLLAIENGRASARLFELEVASPKERRKAQ